MKIKAVPIKARKVVLFGGFKTVGEFQKSLQSSSADVVKQGLYKIELLKNSNDFAGARALIETWPKNNPYYIMEDKFLKTFGF